MNVTNLNGLGLDLARKKENTALHLLCCFMIQTQAFNKVPVVMRIIHLTCAVLALTNSVLSENIIGGEGIGGVMWFVRYTFKFT